MNKKELLFDNVDSLKRFIIYILNDRIREIEDITVDDRFNSINVKTDKIVDLLKIKDKNIGDTTIFLLFLDLKKIKNINIQLNRIEKEFENDINIVIVSASDIENLIKKIEKKYWIDFWGKDKLEELVKVNRVYYSNSLDISRLYNNKNIDEINELDFKTYRV